MLIGVASLLAIQCTCQPNLETPKAKLPQESIPPKPLLTEITDEMIEAAEKAPKKFLAEQLKKLQKEGRTNNKVAYINNVEPGGTMAALHSAVDSHFKRPDIVKALLERGADPNQLVDQRPPLHEAISSSPEQNLDNIRLLLDAGADPTLAVKDFYPIYTVITWSGDTALEVVELMLTKVADINKQYAEGNTLLHWAVNASAPKIVELLLKKNADFNIPNEAGKTAKEIAQSKNRAVKDQFK
jgi:serine/threonine-protein phosphatase 6 regulatory ankyrin repeat subunit B